MKDGNNGGRMEVEIQAHVLMFIKGMGRWEKEREGMNKKEARTGFYNNGSIMQQAA